MGRLPHTLLAVHVQVHLRPESLDAFKEASLASATASLREPGVLRFDVLQDRDAPERFVVVEVLVTGRAAARSAALEGALRGRGLDPGRPPRCHAAPLRRR